MTGSLRTAVMLLALFGSSCSRGLDQEETETQMARTISGFYQMHVWDKPHVAVTNLQHLYQLLGRAYPHTFDRDLRRFGKHSGFTNSFFEKYAFFPPGSTSQLAGGEIVFMNSQPFPMDNDQLGRLLIVKTGSGYGIRGFGEQDVQKILKAQAVRPFPIAGISPKPPRADLPPKDSLPTVAHNKIFDLCDAMGLSREAAGRIWLVLIWSPFPLFVLLAGWLWRRSRRESH